MKPNSENYVASGCFDKMIRIWNVKQRKVIDWQQTHNYITAMQINQQGDKLVVGQVDGVCLVYDYTIQFDSGFFGHAKIHPQHQIGSGSATEKLKLERSIDVKNNNGKFSGGRKVTGIDFFNQNYAMVTTNDSRVRFVNILTGRTIMKLKGNKNESFHLRASLSPDLSYVICGSEDGDVYLWS